MKYTSTRGKQEITSAEAIMRGIAEDGGLFVPTEFPKLNEQDIATLLKADYKGRAKLVLSKYLTDFSDTELDNCVNGAYTSTFDNNQPAPLKHISGSMNILELWHGPTCAFKDLALQILPYLLVTSIRKVNPGREVVILVATSGDTGKAALAGFADVPGTRIIVFFPENGVSAMQKLQMQTQEGKNVAVCGIEGNFDDAQTGVKAIFGDDAMQRFLNDRQMSFSSANSINFGRLVPQVVYYVSAYCDLVNQGQIKQGESFNVCVPTGNFGNILAAYYAKQMGIPINKLICASNQNKILTDFFQTGVYDRNRDFFTTSSPSMDILISSNLERLLYHVCAQSGNGDEVKKMMSDLKTNGKYSVPADLLAKLNEDFYGAYCDEKGTAETICAMDEEYHYLSDTHTAVALSVYDQYIEDTGDRRPCVIASTASPYKFATAVLPAVSSAPFTGDDFQRLERLSQVSGTPIPAPLAGLKDKPVLHKSCVQKQEMAQFIKTVLDK